MLFVTTAVQHERGPRNSTLRRQMSLYFKESSITSESPPPHPPPPSSSPPPPPPIQPPSSVTSTVISHSSSPLSLHLPSVAVSSPLSFPFSFPPFPPPLDLKLGSPRFPSLPIGRTTLELPPPHPDLAAFALNRFHALTTRPPPLLAPTPKVSVDSQLKPARAA